MSNEFNKTDHAQATENIQEMTAASVLVIDIMQKIVDAQMAATDHNKAIDAVHEEMLQMPLTEMINMASSTKYLANGAKIVSQMLMACIQDKLSRDPSLVHEVVDLVVQSMEESERADGEAVAKAGPDE